jgi:hypothetical protein
MVKKKGRKKATVSHMDHYIHAFSKCDRAFFMTVIFDFSYLIMFFGLGLSLLWLFALLLDPAAAAFQSISQVFSLLGSPDQLTSSAEASLEGSFNALQSFFVQAALFIVASLLLLFAVTSLYKGFIWGHLTKQKITQGFILQFVKVNVLWQALWFGVTALTFVVFDPVAATALLFVELLVYMYFTPFLRSQLTPKHTLQEIYKKTFVEGVKRIPHFIFPIIMIVVTCTFGLWIAGALFQFAGAFSVVLLLVLCVFLVMSWARFYFSIVAQHVTK